jgi:hypothetical protein
MKNKLFILILFSLVGCKKHDMNPNQSKTNSIKKFIIVGTKNDCMVYKNYSTPLQTTYNSKNILNIDIDSDKTNDIGFACETISENGHFYFYLENTSFDISTLPLSSQVYSTDSNNIHFYGKIKGFNLNDTINKTSGWTTQKDTINKSGITKHRIYNQLNLSYNYSYIGFRFTKNSDTLYGWMRISFTGNCCSGNITVYDYAYQKQ